jgi:hypothetical protein
MTSAQDLAAWLRTLPTVIDAKPVLVKIERSTYAAARYRIKVTAPAGSRAATEGWAASLEDRFYCLGSRPSSHLLWTGKVCYLLAGDPCEWFLGAWADETVTGSPRFATYHPHGPWFGLHRWTLPGAIDAGITGYQRLPAEDIGAISGDYQWLLSCIDWDQAADELKVDYTSVEYDGDTYYYQS